MAFGLDRLVSSRDCSSSSKGMVLFRGDWSSVPWNFFGRNWPNGSSAPPLPPILDCCGSDDDHLPLGVLSPKSGLLLSKPPNSFLWLFWPCFCVISDRILSNSFKDPLVRSASYLSFHVRSLSSASNRISWFSELFTKSPSDLKNSWRTACRTKKQQYLTLK